MTTFHDNWQYLQQSPICPRQTLCATDLYDTYEVWSAPWGSQTNDIGLETRDTMTPMQRQWKRQVIHQVIHATMYPIKAVMKSGIVIDCANGK